MANTNTLVRTLGTAGIALMALAGPALAEDRQFTWSVTGAAFSDYIFRGYSQTNEDPTAQASLDIGYGIFYAGIYGAITTEVYNATNTEIDFYAGLKPVLGPATFDFGVIYYYYPHQKFAFNGGLEVSYVELKAAVSVSPVKNLTTSLAAYYTPDYSFEKGDGLAVEGTVAYALPQVGIFAPTISGTLGNQQTDLEAFADKSSASGFTDEYWYWNVGLALAVEKFIFDLRYWDTDTDSGISDERFVAGFKITLP